MSPPIPNLGYRPWWGGVSNLVGEGGELERNEHENDTETPKPPEKTATWGQRR